MMASSSIPHVTAADIGWAGQPARARLRLLDDVELMNRPDPEYLVHGVLPAQCLAPAYGLPEAGKSFLFSVDLGLSIATGRAWFGYRIVNPGPVVVVAAEGSTAMKLRVKAWKTAHGYPMADRVGYYVLAQSIDLSDPADVQRFIDAVGPLSPRLVIIDTLPRCLGSFEENSNSEMGRAVEAMDRIKVDTGAVVMPVAHSDKQAKDIRGASALRGAADVMFRVVREDDLRIISCDKIKDGEPFPDIKVKLVPVPGTDSVVPRPLTELLPTGKMTQSQYTIWSKLMEMFGDHGATCGEWQQVVPNVAPATFYRAKSVLEGWGAVVKHGPKFSARPVPPDRLPDA